MLKKNIVKAIGLICLASLLSLSHTHTGFAAQKQNKKFGSWLMHCSDISVSNGTEANTTEQSCALFQSVAAKNRPRFGLTILISRDDNTKPSKSRPKNSVGMMKFLVPLGILLPTGIGMNIDGNDLGLTGFLRCLPNGCTAIATLTDDLLAKLKSAKTASFTIFLTPEDGLAIPIQLDGFTQGFKALGN